MSNVGALGGVSPVNIQSMDLETAMMVVQSNRANLLESQLKDQISSVQARNDQISKLNQLLGVLNKAAANFGGDAKADTKLDASKINVEELKSAAQSAGVDLSAAGLTVQQPEWTVTLKDGTKIPVDAAGKAEAEHCKNVYWAFRSSDYSGNKAVVSIVETKPAVEITKGKLDGAIQQMKSQIDSLSNSQQMDMLRLQSLSNKRNEAFETMTNFVKKMQDSRSSIVGNMR